VAPDCPDESLICARSAQYLLDGRSVSDRERVAGYRGPGNLVRACRLQRKQLGAKGFRKRLMRACEN